MSEHSSADADGSADDPVVVVRAALATAVSSLAAFDEHSPGAEFAAKRVLNTLVEALLPIQDELIATTDFDRGGPLASALGFLRNAFEQIDDGDVAAARSAVVTAHVALARLDRDPGDGSRDADPGDWRM